LEDIRLYPKCFKAIFYNVVGASASFSLKKSTSNLNPALIASTLKFVIIPFAVVILAVFLDLTMKLIHLARSHLLKIILKQ